MLTIFTLALFFWYIFVLNLIKLGIYLNENYHFKGNLFNQIKSNRVFECNFDSTLCGARYTSSNPSLINHQFLFKTNELINGENYYITDYSSICKLKLSFF